MMITAADLDRIKYLAQQLRITDGQLNEIILMRYRADSILYLRKENALNLEQHLMRLVQKKNNSRKPRFVHWVCNIFRKAA